MASSPLTVVQILPELESGGVERGTLEISRALVARGHRSIVVSAGGRLVEQLVSAGGEHVSINLGKKSPFTLLQIAHLKKVLVDIQPQPEAGEDYERPNLSTFAHVCPLGSRCWPGR